MKLLVVAATESEIGKFKNHLNTAKYANIEVAVLITGVGPIATTYAVTKALTTNQFDFVLQAGVGGSFDIGIPLGELRFINSDSYGDLGAEDHDKYIDIFELGLITADAAPHTGGKLLTPYSVYHSFLQLPVATGLTVSQVSGNERTIAHRRSHYNCAVESMEGAAFHYVCINEGLAFAQVRAISNYVIPRDKSQWKMKEAIIALNDWLIGFTTNLEQHYGTQL